MHPYYTAVIKFLLFLALFTSAMTGAASVLTVDHTVGFYQGESAATYLEDNSNQHDISSIENLPASAFAAPPPRLFKGGYSTSTFWIRLPLFYRLDAKDDDRSHDWVLEIDYAALDYIDVYHRPNGQLVHLQSGDRRPQSVRRAPNNVHSFYLRFPPNQTHVVYIKVQTTSSLQVPLNIWSPAGIYEARNTSQLGYGIYAGILLIMAAYNLMLFFSLRERSYVYYVSYILCFGLLQTAIAGLNAQYLWPNSTEWNNTSIPFFMGASCLFAVLFTRSFLATASHSRRTDVFLKLVAVVCACHALMSFFVSYELALTTGNTLTLFITVILLSTGVQAVMNNSPGAQYFLCGWALLLIGSTIFMLVSTGVVPPNAFTENAARYGSAAEALLLALALGEKIKAFREERNRVALNAREDLRAGNKELSMGLAQLQQSDQLKDEFLAKVSHELRTPLNGILGSLELMKLEHLPEEVEEYAQSATVSAEHMLELVNTLLNFSEARSNTANVSTDMIELGNLFEELRTNYVSQLRDKNLRFSAEIDDQVPSLLLGDASKLKLVLSQLLDNAIKFSANGRIELLVTPLKLSIDSSRIEFILQDCGVGISRENLSRVFDPFAQAPNSEPQSGLGMGLAISQQLIHRMHGDIEAQESASGARIKMELPFKLPKHAN